MSRNMIMRIIACVFVSLMVLSESAVAQHSKKKYHVEFKLTTAHSYVDLSQKINEWINSLSFDNTKVIDVNILPNPSSQ